MDKIDYKKKLASYAAKKNTPEGISVPELTYLAVDGAGDPNTAESFKNAVEALFTVAYTIKFAYKKKTGTDFAVMPLEGQFWTDDMNQFSQTNKDIWKWTLLVLQPEFITSKDVEEAKEAAFKKKGNDTIKVVQLRQLAEGTAAQLLHIGPYSQEAENIQKIHAFIKAKGGTFDGLKQKHHEIYLSDMRKTAPEKLKTIIRQPYV